MGQWAAQEVRGLATMGSAGRLVGTEGHEEAARRRSRRRSVGSRAMEVRLEAGRDGGSQPSW